MDPRDRVLGPIAVGGGDEPERVDFGNLVRKLVLSDEVILESGPLSEFPALVRKFGYDGVRELLESKRVRVLADFVTFAQTGQTEILEDRARRGILPAGSYSFSIVRLHDLRQHLHENLQKVDEVPGLRGKQGQTLRKLIADRLIPRVEDRGQKSLEQLNQDLAANVPLLRVSIAMATKRHLNADVAAGDFSLRIDQIADGDWRVETDLGARTGLGDDAADTAVEHGLLGVAGFNQRLELMARYEALTGFRAGELPLMEEKLTFLARQLDPDVQAERFERVIELVGLPDVDPNPEVHDVDLPRLLDIVASDETHQFRAWLRGIDTFDDSAVMDELHRVRESLSNAVRSKAGKAVRYLATTGLGIAIPPAGVAAGALDMFLTERIVKGHGPTAFLSRLYPSVFQQT